MGNTAASRTASTIRRDREEHSRLLSQPGENDEKGSVKADALKEERARMEMKMEMEMEYERMMKVVSDHGFYIS